MSAASYVPGAWTGLVCDRLVALVVLGGSSEPPPFALATLARTGVLHAALCGDVDVVMASSSGVRELRGPDDAPWTEVTAHDVPALTVRAAGGGDGAEPLPLVAGVVLASVLRVTAEPWDRTPDEPASFDDHEGLTIVRGELGRLRTTPARVTSSSPAPSPAPARVPVARIVLSTGLVVPLDRTVLLGRAPQVGRVSNAELPRVVTVPSPNQDVSRTHAEVRQEGEQVLVTDLGSLNGVRMVRPGAAPRRLHPAEPTVVVPGDVVDLGDGATFTLRCE